MILQKTRPWQYLVPGAIILLALASTLWHIHKKLDPSDSSPVTDLQPLVPPLAQDPAIEVFFNQSEANIYTDPYRQITRHGDNLEAVIIKSIEQAETSIDVAVQALNLPLVAQALIDSHHRGVQVRLILENQYSTPWSETATEKAAQKIAQAQLADWAYIADANQDGQSSAAELANIDALLAIQSTDLPWIDDTADGSKGSGLMHHKFIVVDQRWVITGSANFTLSGIHGDAADPLSRGNANGLLKIDSPTLAQQMTAEFNLMWGDGPNGKLDSRFGLKKPPRTAASLLFPSSSQQKPASELTVQFSPVSSTQPWHRSTNGLIAQTLASATQRIDLALFVFSSQALANQLKVQSEANVQMRALIESSFIYRDYSEALDLLGKSRPNRRCRQETDNEPWAKPVDAVGSPLMPPGDKLHHKFAVVDSTTVITGSHNWSRAANVENDETLLVIQSPIVAAHFSREFERLYRTASTGNTPQLQRQIAADRQRCG